MNGALPTGWSIATLADVAEFSVGRTPSRANPDYWSSEHGSGVPWITISDMQPYRAVTTTTERVSRKALRDVFAGRLVPRGTLVMSFKLTIGRIATLGVDACHNEAIVSIRPKTVHQGFLGYYLSQVDYTEYQDRAIKGQTLNLDKLARIRVVLPPAKEQALIADILDLARHAIELDESSLGAMNELKQAAFRQVMSLGLRREPTKDTGSGVVPSSWALKTLGDTCGLATGTTPSTKRADYYDGDVPFVKTADIVNNRIRVSSTSISRQAVSDYSLRIFPPGTVLMAMYGQGKTRGQVSLLEIPAATSQNAAAIEPAGQLEPRFLWYYLMSQYQLLRGSGSLGHLSHLNLGYLREWPIAVPSLQEQQEIAAVFDAIEAAIAVRRRQAGASTEAFTCLLEKLMSGETRVGKLNPIDDVGGESDHASNY